MDREGDTDPVSAANGGLRIRLQQDNHQPSSSAAVTPVQNNSDNSDNKGSIIIDNNIDGKDGAEGGKATKRLRGRPAGSKNKPKSPVTITQDAALRTHVLEVADGRDIVESVSVFAQRQHRGVCILNATGAVSNVTLRQPGSPGAVMILQGQFNILSISGSFLPSMAPPAASGLAICLASGKQGQVVGGSVAGPLLASGTVVIVATSFGDATYYRFHHEETRMPIQGVDWGFPSGSGGEYMQTVQQPPQQQAPNRLPLPPNLHNSIQFPNDSCWPGGSYQ